MALSRDLILHVNEDEKQLSHLGPAMKALDPQHRRFVYAVLELGSNDFTSAALAAGYPDNGGNSLRMKGYHLSHREDIQKAFNEEVRKRLTAHGPLAATVLTKVIGDPASDDKNRLKAIEMLFNRIGMHEVREEKHMVEVHHVDDAEMIRQARQLIKEARLPLAEARKLLGDRADEILEGVFTEIELAPVSETDDERAEREFEESLK